MKKYQRKIALDYIKLLHQSHDMIKKFMKESASVTVVELLGQCQEAAGQLGEMIEVSEGEGFAAVGMLEEYCEQLFQTYISVSQGLSLEADQICEQLTARIDQIENSIKTDIKEHLEIVFLPYEVSMWDSLESVWMAADADENCDAYVIPIPYYDKNPDGSVKKVHYEWDRYPGYVPVTKYDQYDFAERQPDVIFIHNPYDGCNYVTSVPPFFYSENLKKFTKMLVYIPYYSTAGGMNEGQAWFSSYYRVDYIITQSQKYRKFFAPDLPDEKLVPLGSPKFDRILRLCKNPPEPSAAWKNIMEGKKVYFYNTTLGAALGNTRAFLKKMEYVFRCFLDRTDVCLLWRPHPLLESTFASSRAEYKPVYDALKRYFINNAIGIYDDTPDIADTIALCDAYIGDAGTSVTSLFGIAGKPLFILNNDIHNLPDADDWKGGIVRGFSVYGSHEWLVTQGNKLYHSDHHDYKYKYCLDLSEYAYGNYYQQIITIRGKHYVCPANAQDILVVGDGRIEKRIQLEKCMEQAGAFYGAVSSGDYLLLLPNNYPAIVRYDTKKEDIRYFRNHLDLFTGYVQGEKRTGGYCVQNGILYIASTRDNRVLAIDTITGEEEIKTVPAEHMQGCSVLVSDGRELWFLPYEGTVVVRWNPRTGEMREYEGCPNDLKCVHPVQGYECMQRPFSWAAFYGDDVYLSPYWANMYIRLNRHSGQMTEWKPPFEEPEEAKNGYYSTWVKSSFIRRTGNGTDSEWLLFSCCDRKLYAVDLETDAYREIKIGFDLEELREQEPGFQKNSQWLQYACEENAFNSLEDFLNGTITGSAFDRETQIEAFCGITANYDGTCGEKIYEFVRGKWKTRQEERI